MKKILEKILKDLARGVLNRQKPEVVTVTGSVGKTSTKEAIYVVLKSKFNTRRSIKNYNNEIGVPMTVFNTKSPGKNIIAWLFIFLKAVFLTIFRVKSYPKVLVLEIGSDKPGDLKYLMEMIPSYLIKAAVLTAVAPVHLEFFHTMENVLKEKTVPFEYLPETGTSIVNKDCVQGYDGADTYYSMTDFSEAPTNLCFPHQAYAPLAAISVGKVFSISKDEAKQILDRDYQVMPGRGRRIAGINKSVLIDDTYNSSPISAQGAIKALANSTEGSRKIAVLGDMLELGEGSEEFHKQVGQLLAGLNIDYLITYGREAESIATEAEEINNLNLKISKFQTLDEIVSFLKDLIEENDLVLIKGSQGMRMEKIVKHIMADPSQADKLLVRQNKEWLKK